MENNISEQNPTCTLNIRPMCSGHTSNKRPLRKQYRMNSGSYDDENFDFETDPDVSLPETKICDLNECDDLEENDEEKNDERPLLKNSQEKDKENVLIPDNWTWRKLICGRVFLTGFLLFCLVARVSQGIAKEERLHAALRAILAAQFRNKSESDSCIMEMTYPPQIQSGEAPEHASLRHDQLLQPVEKKVLAVVYTQLLNRQESKLIDVMKGAHVVVNDHGQFFECFQRFSPDMYHRISSHYSSVQQYAIPQGKMLITLLVGKTKQNDTWFQLEGNGWDPLHHPFESFMHVLNYFEYVIRGVQIGPMGTSVHTDSNPLRVTPRHSILQAHA